MLKVLSLVVDPRYSLFFVSKLRFDVLFRQAVFPEQSAGGVTSTMTNQSTLVTNSREDLVDGVFANRWVLSAHPREQPATTTCEAMKFFESGKRLLREWTHKVSAHLHLGGRRRPYCFIQVKLFPFS